MAVSPTAKLSSTALFSAGFRPFFLGGSLWAAGAMALWIALITGQITFAQSYGAVAWHAHEFLFGYVTASLAGFLLTAIPNWTGRLPVRGGPLLALFLIWVVGRAALLAVDVIGVVPAAVVDSLFLPCLGIVAMREIVAGGNWRNARIAVLVTLLALANIVFHAEVIVAGMPFYGLRGGIAVMVVIITVIGGRITPSFTHNWLAARGGEHLPVSFGRYDMAAVALGAIALILWIALPETAATGVLLLVAGVAHAIRLWRWAGRRTWREPLLVVLHIGYAFVPLGFFCVGVSVLWPALLPVDAAIHAWTAGAMGMMTLAVMTRASRGHLGYELTARPPTQAIYLAIGVAALARLAVPFAGSFTMPLLSLAGAAWIAAFLGFVALYGPKLLLPRRRATATA
jgi:uncharacterized protein involved in response to NO